MKSIVDYITEKAEEGDAKVYVVKDKQDGSIVNVADSEDEAKKIGAEYKDGNPDNDFEIEVANKSDYVK